MSSPFKPMLPYDGRVLLLAYEPLLPVCVANVEDGESSESASETTSDESEEA